MSFATPEKRRPAKLNPRSRRLAFRGLAAQTLAQREVWRPAAHRLAGLAAPQVRRRRLFPPAPVWRPRIGPARAMPLRLAALEIRSGGPGHYVGAGHRAGDQPGRGGRRSGPIDRPGRRADPRAVQLADPGDRAIVQLRGAIQAADRAAGPIRADPGRSGDQASRAVQAGRSKFGKWARMIRLDRPGESIGTTGPLSAREGNRIV